MGYAEQRYEGRGHYQCTDCPFDTFELDRMRGHIEERHPQEKAARPPKPPAAAGRPEAQPAQPTKGGEG